MTLLPPPALISSLPAPAEMASLPEPLGYNTEAMFGSYDYPDLTIMRFRPWQIRLAEAGKPDALKVWRQE